VAVWFNIIKRYQANLIIDSERKWKILSIVSNPNWNRITVSYPYRDTLRDVASARVSNYFLAVILNSIGRMYQRSIDFISRRDVCEQERSIMQYEPLLWNLLARLRNGNPLSPIGVAIVWALLVPTFFDSQIFR